MIRADQVKIKGFLYVKDQKIPFIADTSVQLPGQLKNIMKVQMPQKESTLVQVLNGDKAWVRINGMTQAADPKDLVQMQEMMNMDRVVRLVPLLQGNAYRLTDLGESKAQGGPVVGVRVTAKGHRDIRLYFDKASGLLVKTEHTVSNENRQDVPQEETYSDFKDLNGYRRPTRVSAYRNGEKFMEGELIDVKQFDKIPDTEFGQP